MMWARMETSRAETGSSSTMRRALVESARAMASRCRWPPLNSCGNRRATSGRKPTSSRRCTTRARTSAEERRSCALIGSAMISPTRMPGLSELYVSWTPPGPFRRSPGRAGPRRCPTLRPSTSMVPDVGASAASTSFDVVVLPHPDSPTRPSVSPALIVKLIPSTALTTVRLAPNSELPIGKCFWRSCTSRSGLATRRGLLDGQPASNAAGAVQIVLLWLFEPAAVDRPRAAGLEAGPGRKARRIGRLTRDAAKRLLDAELRNGIEEGPRVRMAGLVEQPPHRLHLHDLSRVHHRDPVTHLGDDAEVVGDEDQRDAGRALEILQQIQVLQLDGDVEVRRGLVRDDDP